MRVSKEIENLKPYKAGKPIEETKRELGLDSVFKLASNENPLGPSPRVLERLREALHELHRYPDASFFELTKAYSEAYNIPEDHLSFGNGSNEVIDLLIRLYCEPGDAIAASKYSFIAYKICATAARVHCVESKMGEDLRYDLKALEKDLRAYNANQSKSTVKLVFIANPNNPTGTYLKESELDEFLSAIQDLSENTYVVLDEAYNEFVRAPDYADGMKLFRKYENVMLIRTMSKAFGLAGLRVGALVARPQVIEYFNRIRNPFNVNSLAQVAALEALKDKEYLEASQKMTWEGLDYFFHHLDRLGIKYWPSQTNFLLIQTKGSGQEWYEFLLKKGVITRPLAGYGLTEHLRISVGTESENEAAIKAIEALLGSQ